MAKSGLHFPSFTSKKTNGNNTALTQAERSKLQQEKLKNFNIQEIPPETLKVWISHPDDYGTFKVIDVRDLDHDGGHIIHSHNYPYNSLSILMETLTKDTKDLENVIFHCMSSEIRSPAAAIKYAQTMHEKKESGEFSNIPNIYILKGGYQRWKALNENDRSVTEGVFSW